MTILLSNCIIDIGSLVLITWAIITCYVVYQAVYHHFHHSWYVVTHQAVDHHTTNSWYVVTYQTVLEHTHQSCCVVIYKAVFHHTHHSWYVVTHQAMYHHSNHCWYVVTIQVLIKIEWGDIYRAGWNRGKWQTITITILTTKLLIKWASDDGWATLWWVWQAAYSRWCWLWEDGCVLLGRNYNVLLFNTPTILFLFFLYSKIFLPPSWF